MISKKNKTKGFTLIELLVVVAIIGLISSIAFASMSAVRAKNRNAARLLAIDTLVDAFNLSRGDGQLPVTCEGAGCSIFNRNIWACVTDTCYEGWSWAKPNETVNAFLAPSLPKRPSDPKGGIRHIGGFLYVNPLDIAGAKGAYINYIMEPSGSCGPGRLQVTMPTYTQCFLKID